MLKFRIFMQLVNRYLLTVWVLLALVGCQNNPTANSTVQPSDQLTQKSHVLEGKIWDVANEKYIDKPQLVDTLVQSTYVLLGETHDNIQHHQDHAWLINQLVLSQHKPALAFEMINNKQVQAIQDQHPATSTELLDILENAKTGWEYKKYYSAIFNEVFNAKLAIHTADLDKTTLMQIMRDGIQAAPPDVQHLLQNNPLTDEVRASLEKEIEATHCGMATEKMVKSMMLGQRVRDATIALNLFKIHRDGAPITLLIAGSGHDRTDRGAPMYLRSLDPAAIITSIAWMEVDKDTIDPRRYADAWNEAKLPFDFVVFTAQTDRVDPCEEMKQFMHHMKKQKESD